MQSFKNILLVCDEASLNDRVTRRAVRLALANGARVTLVDFMEGSSAEMASVLAPLPEQAVEVARTQILEHHAERLRAIAGEFEENGIATDALVLSGVPFIEVVRQVLRGGHDLVMKGVGGRSAVMGMFFASTDLHLLRKCPCPVWLVKAGRASGYKRILAAVDSDRVDRINEELNGLILDLGSSLSEMDGSALDILHAWNFEGEELLRRSRLGQVIGGDVDAFVRARRGESKERLATLTARCGRRERRRTHLIKGRAERVIPAFARRNEVDLIVMGTVGRTGLAGFFIGNTAEAILGHVTCSVLAVKPSGFETPVTPDEGTALRVVPREPSKTANPLPY